MECRVDDEVVGFFWHFSSWMIALSPLHFMGRIPFVTNVVFASEPMMLLFIELSASEGYEVDVVVSLETSDVNLLGDLTFPRNLMFPRNLLPSVISLGTSASLKTCTFYLGTS